MHTFLIIIYCNFFHFYFCSRAISSWGFFSDSKTFFRIEVFSLSLSLSWVWDRVWVYVVICFGCFLFRCALFSSVCLRFSNDIFSGFTFIALSLSSLSVFGVFFLCLLLRLYFPFHNHIKLIWKFWVELKLCSSLKVCWILISFVHGWAFLHYHKHKMFVSLTLCLILVLFIR